MSYKTRDRLSFFLVFSWIALYTLAFFMLISCNFPLMSIWRYRLTFISLATAIISAWIVNMFDFVAFQYDAYSNVNNLWLVHVSFVVMLISYSLFVHCYSFSKIAFVVDFFILLVIIKKYILSDYPNNPFNKCICDSVAVLHQTSAPSKDGETTRGSNDGERVLPYTLSINKTVIACPIWQGSLFVSSTILLYYFVHKISITQWSLVFCELRPIFNLFCKFFVVFGILFSIIWIVDYSYLQYKKDEIIKLIPNDQEYNFAKINELGYFVEFDKIPGQDAS